MSRYSLEYLQSNTRIGFTDKRGGAWHRDMSVAVADSLNHFPGAIPMDFLVGETNGLFNFEIVDAPLFVQIDGMMMPIETRKAQVRTDNGAIMGVHSEKYVGHSYKSWLIDNLSAMVGGGAEFANAGLLANGAQAWVQIEMPEGIDAGAGIVVRPFLLATTSFDGSIATTYKTGFTNVVCDNTFNMFMGESGETYKRRHTRNSEFELLSAAAAVNTLSLVADKVTADIERLLSVEVGDKMWSKFVEAHAPITEDSSERSVSLAETKRAALTGLWRTDVRVAPWAGTAWGVVQAVNTYNEHMSIVRNVDPFERKMSNAVAGKTGAADLATVKTLGAVLERDLLA